MTTEIKLPEGVKESDLKYPKFSAKNLMVHTLDFYYTQGFGWCIATLHIRNAGSRNTNKDARTYAVRVSDGQCCRVGLGPHVLKRITVYVTEKRLKDLQKFVDLKNKGEGEANQIRDRISTRRAQTELERQRRQFGPFGW